MSEYVWIDATEVRSTDRARLFETEAGEVWIPKSAIGAANKKTGRVEVARWLAEKRGLVDGKDDR